MPAFDRKFVKRMNRYKQAAAKAQAEERALIDAFESIDYGEIERLIELIEMKGHPTHQSKIADFKEKLISGKISGDDIVVFQDVVEANKVHLGAEEKT